jgi:hypothetical protein
MLDSLVRMKDLKLYSAEKPIQEIKADNLFAFEMLFKRKSKKLNNFSNLINALKGVSVDILQDVPFIEPG